ncbi:MAG: hypothetical protein Q9M94_01700 [Candidatus Gracilibacteria bacterium]|nr:hypothetical protein [Candidatus Gracilibacteria bacterium]
MIYLFTGNSDFLVREKTLKWKKLFTEKNGDFNLVHFKSLEEIDNNQITENLLAEGFMGEKKLIIIDNFPINGENKNSKSKDKEEFLGKIVDNIPENNIVIFSSSNIDKRAKFYKHIKKIATKIEEFNTKSEQDIYTIIEDKYRLKIDFPAINLLVKYKGGNLAKCISEIKKLLITKNKINAGDIKKFIEPELEESIFQIIDDILNKNIPEAISKIRITLNNTNIYAFYNNLLANLRTSVYISKLKNLKTPNNEIGSILNLGNRAFLVNKNHKIGHKSLEILYISLINLDKKMKGGKLMGTEEKDFQFEVERCIISNQ